MFSGSFAPEARQRFAVRDLKLRAVMMASLVPRTIKEAMRISPQAARYSYWIDTFGLDSQYDYDPVSAKCVELPRFNGILLSRVDSVSFSRARRSFAFESL